MSHCLLCGQEMQDAVIESRVRQICPHCGWIFYPQLKVSAGVLLEEQGKLLLVQRAIEPWKGFWYLPAGYIEVDEDPSCGAMREAKEEIGLIVSIKDLHRVSMYRDDPRGNGILIVYTAERIGGNLYTSNESLAVDFFTPHEVRFKPLAGSSHAEVIQHWIKEKENG